jgi:hypothetical protein
VQTILSDVFASLSIGFDKPFEIGDFVVFNDVAGTVEHIGLKPPYPQPERGADCLRERHSAATERCITTNGCKRAGSSLPSGLPATRRRTKLRTVGDVVKQISYRRRGNEV